MMARTIKPMCERRFRIRRLVIVTGATAMLVLLLINFAIRFIAVISEEEVLSSPWHYKCVDGLCRKTLITENTTSPLSLSVCQLFCSEAGGLWPKPTGNVSVGNHVAQLDPNNIRLTGADYRTKAGKLLYQNVDELINSLRRLKRSPSPSRGFGMKINAPHEFAHNSERLTLDAPEGYTLKICQLNNGELQAEIESKSYFGARHALETLAQLIVWDDLHNMFKIARDVEIADRPAFAYRGILLDTARNFMNKTEILKTIKAMSMAKLNTFHWHITDSHSFPYVSKSLPLMSKYGAYSPDKVYTPEDIEEIVDEGILRGVRVLPEFDAPAHVGEGWQWVGHNATVCFNAQPWNDYCVEPPCGQLNPTSEKVYEILGDIYKDMLESFKPDLFHMGGDEVKIECWNSSEAIRNWMIRKHWNLTKPDFYKLWDHFQSRAYDILKKANDGQDIPAILWTSGLTNEYNLKKLDPKKYIIQIWTTGNDQTIGRLIQKGFRVIFSNYDALYLDCGFGAWVGQGNNWCSPYKGWQLIYENSPMRILGDLKFDNSFKSLVLGAEAALWSEQVDSTSVDARLWPRASAMAERLWSDPVGSWKQAEQRFLKHRERLVEMGIQADALKPEWCLRNQGYCVAETP